MVFYALLDFSTLTDDHTNNIRNEIQEHFENKSSLKRKESVAAKALLCFMLKHHFDLTEFTVSCDANGKPYIDESDIQFNLSHSGDYALCVCGKEKNGCDIEQIKPYNEKVAKRFFSEKEFQLLQRTADKSYCFTKLWTLKESALKYTGQGVSGGLDRYDFSEYYMYDSFSTDGLRFNSFFIPGYSVSICSENSDVIEFEVNITDLINKDF